MTQIECAEMIKELMAIRDSTDRMLDLLLPDAESECAHPSDQIEDLSTMDDNDQRYRCRRCGAESPVPFPSIH